MATGPKTGGDSDAALIVMAKRPRPGAVKTRLEAALGPVRPASLYAAMLDDVLATCSQLVPRCRVVCSVFPPDSAGWFVRRVPDGIEVAVQRGANLAERMSTALDEQFARGCSPVAVLGSDCPTVSADRIQQGIDGARVADVVLGPDAGGGFFLIGLRAPPGRLLHVDDGAVLGFDAVRRAARGAGRTVQVLETERDIDTPADLAWLEGRARSDPSGFPRTRDWLRQHRG